jgi:hypothetical protein
MNSYETYNNICSCLLTSSLLPLLREEVQVKNDFDPLLRLSVGTNSEQSIYYVDRSVDPSS